VSLRSRLLLVVLGLVVIGLAVTDVVTYRALRSFLLDRVDQQLVAAAQPALDNIFPQPDEHRRGGPPEKGVSPAIIPAGSYAYVYDAQGLQVGGVGGAFVYTGQPQPDDGRRPSLGDIQPTRSQPFTVDSVDGSGKFRAQLTGYGSAGSRVLVAIPINDVIQTLHRLVAIEVLATALVVLVVGGVALVLVRAGLKPLEEFGAVAEAIADGDLSRRVPLADSRTEVGRLGTSLNTMLGQIQSAFEARQASEERLRRFVADASHELRTPLTSIRGYAELFRRGAAERPADLAKAMRRIEEEASRMGVLVDDLLLLARLDQGRPLQREDVDLARVAADAVDDARVAFPDRTITIHTPSRLRVVGDEARLRQVAANLVSNACDHTPPDAGVDVRVTVDDDGAVLEVADQGPGLDAAAAGRVFERFYRADPSRARAGGGSGLGLSIVAAIAEAHGGRATVESAPGAGARFRVWLPADVPPADETTAPPASDTPPAPSEDGEPAPVASPWARAPRL